MTTLHADAHSDQSSRPSRIRDGMEVAAVLAIIVAGLAIATVTEWIVMGPLGILAATVAALWFVKRDKERFALIGLRRASWWRTGLLALAGIVGVNLFVALAAAGIVAATGETPDTSALHFIEGNLPGLLGMLVIGWTTAAIGEEIVFRGFVLQRFERIVGGPPVLALGIAIVAQSALFGLGHSYQGLAGMLQVVAVGLGMGVLFVLTKRNLWVCMLVHGLIDTIGLTVLYLGLMPGQSGAA